VSTKKNILDMTLPELALLGASEVASDMTTSEKMAEAAIKGSEYMVAAANADSPDDKNAFGRKAIEQFKLAGQLSAECVREAEAQLKP